MKRLFAKPKNSIPAQVWNRILREKYPQSIFAYKSWVGKDVVFYKKGDEMEVKEYLGDVEVNSFTLPASYIEEAKNG